MVAYENYLRPRLLKIQVYSLTILKQQLQKSQNWLELMLWSVALPLFVLLVLGMGIVMVRKQNKTELLCKECLRYSSHNLELQKYWGVGKQ
jgi:heme/copper-type cytochrome/quinol oxidase subunit 2